MDRLRNYNVFSLLIMKVITNHHCTLCIVYWCLAPGARGDSSDNAGLQHGATGGARAAAEGSHRCCGAAGGSAEGMWSLQAVVLQRQYHYSIKETGQNSNKSKMMAR